MCKVWVSEGCRVSASDTMRKTPGEYVKAIKLAWMGREAGHSRPISGIASVSPLIRLPYWHHKAMVAMGICHLLLHNTAKKLIEKVSNILHVTFTNRLP